MIFSNFKCLSPPSNYNLGKISYLNSQTNPWKELKVENCIVNYGKICFLIVGYTPAEIFNFLNLNNFAKITFSAK
jgi:hypothetical protein